MRNMSFFMTTEQIKAGTKFVTRRLKWKFLKPGDVVRPVVKGQGLKKGEKMQAIRGPLYIVATRWEPLNAITPDECRLEGFPKLTPIAFVEMMCKAHRCEPDKLVNRIQFEYTD